MDVSHCICMENCLCYDKRCRYIIESQALKTLNSIEQIQPRMMVATFDGNPSTTIISCYILTHVSRETGPIAFNNELSSLVHSILKHNVLVIGGDMNAQIGKNKLQIQLTQLIKHKWGISNRFHTRK